MGNYKVIGIKKVEMTEGKNKGKVAFTYFLQCPFSAYEQANTVCLGAKVTSEFSYTDFYVAVGDEVTPVYEKGFQDKAVLVNLVPFPAKSADKMAK